MKKVMLLCSMAGALLLGNVSMSIAQDATEKTDTISADKADPQFYVAEEEAEEGGSGKTIAIIAGVVVVAAAAGYFLLKKKK